MGGEEKILTRAEFESKIIKKAWKDPEYKKRLLESPKSVLEEELCKQIEGIELPESLEVTVHEETPYSIHLTIPVNPADYQIDKTGEISQTETVGTIATIVVIAPVVTEVDIITTVVSTTAVMDPITLTALHVCTSAQTLAST